MLQKFKELVKHSISFGVGGILTTSVGIILIPVYTRELSPDEYGILSLLLITFTVLSTTSALGLNSALVRSYYDYEDEKDRRRLIGTVILLLLSSTILFSGIFAILSSSLSKVIFSDRKYTSLFMLLAVTNIFQAFNLFLLSLMRARKQSRRYSVYNIIRFFIRVTFIIYFVAFLKKGVWGVIYGGMYSSLMFCLILLVTSRKDIIFSFTFTEARKLLRFGLPLIFVSLAGIVMTFMDRFIIKYFADLMEVGIYNLGYQLGYIIQIVLVAPFGLIWPSILLSVRHEKYAKEFYSRVMTYFVFFGLLLSLIAGNFSYEIIGILGTSQYQGGSVIVFPICLSFLLIGMANVLHVGISIARKTEYSTIIVTLAALVNIMLNILLIPRWGIMGAAMATVFASIFMVLFKFYIVRKIYYIKYEWNRISLMFVVAVGLYLLGSLFDARSIWNTILLNSLFVCLFPVLLYFFRFYQKAETETILSFIKKTRSWNVD